MFKDLFAEVAEIVGRDKWWADGILNAKKSSLISVCKSLCNSWRGENKIYLVVKQCKTAVFLPHRPFVASFQGSEASIYLVYQSCGVFSYQYTS